MNTIILKNGIKTIIKKNKNTPRIAVVLYIKLNKDEKYAGLYYLMTQLLLQGTSNRTAEELADETDENAIDISFEKKSDYIRCKVQCLNEDINKALEIFEDVMDNSTFEDYKKEILKIKGEFFADLDSAKVLAQDNYYKTIFKNHSYGVGRKEILEEIDNITKDDIVSAWNDLKENSEKNIAVAGDIDKETVEVLLNNHLKGLKHTECNDERKHVEMLGENLVSTVEKDDSNQAQIFRGWQFPNVYSEDYPKLILINTILGSGGMSSRLFYELREKQGLAYVVRSIWEPYVLSGNFFVYIATEPKNIKTCIDGFEKEIGKIKEELVGEEELKNAKNNAIGKRQFYQETNLSEASLKGYYEFLGKGFEFEEKLKEQIKNVTAEEIKEAANKYFSSYSALCVLAPEKYLKEAGLK